MHIHLGQAEQLTNPCMQGESLLTQQPSNPPSARTAALAIAKKAGRVMLVSEKNKLFFL